MKKGVFILAFCLATFVEAKACFNYFFTIDKDGQTHELGTELLPPFDTNFNNEQLVAHVKKWESRMTQFHSYKYLSDYAIDLLKLGNRKEGLDILIQLYCRYPNEYHLASNLGTAYELNGQVDSALKYIKRGIELNPNDHEGSEWIHVKILEAKKKLAVDSTWLKSHTVLALTLQQKNDSIVCNQIVIQLMERFPFSPGPDALMANLFIDLGDVYANTRSIEYARACYQIAQVYYGAQSEELERKISKMEHLINKFSSTPAPPRSKSEPWKGDNELLHAVSYTTLLRDNDPNHYKIDWSKINMDVKSLLAEVGLTMTVMPTPTISQNQNDSLKSVSDKTDSVAKANAAVETNGKSQPERNNWTYILISLFGVFALASFIRYRIRKS